LFTNSTSWELAPFKTTLFSVETTKLTSILSKTWTTIIFINQTRMKIWVMFWDPTTTSGWTALKFFASQRIQISKWEQIKDDNKEASWHFLKIKVVKNKIAPPFKEASAQFLYNKWFDKLEILINVLLSIKEITQSWAYFKIIYKWTENKFQWRDKLKTWIIENKLYDPLYKIAAKWLLDISTVEVDAEEIVWQDDEID
jgi:recombination protein RecA